MWRFPDLTQVAQIKEFLQENEEITQFCVKINAVDGKVPVKLFGLLNEFLGSDYLTVYPVSSKKIIDSGKVQIDEALCRLEQMEIQRN